jgi:hypothetical protein
MGRSQTQDDWWRINAICLEYAYTKVGYYHEVERCCAILVNNGNDFERSNFAAWNGLNRLCVLQYALISYVNVVYLQFRSPSNEQEPRIWSNGKKVLGLRMKGSIEKILLFLMCERFGRTDTKGSPDFF